MLLRALAGHQLDTAASGMEALARVNSKNYQSVLLDIFLPDSDDLELLRKIKKLQPHCQIIVMTGRSSISMAVNAIKSGAYDFIEKLFNPVEIK